MTAVFSDPSVAVVRAPDGTALHTEVFLPRGDGPWPALLLRTPYGCADQRVGATELISRGFAVVLQDVRGRFGSDGEFDFGASDAEDGASTVAWAVAQPWCDGRVAMRGTSYPAFTQWHALTARPAGLVCAAPIMGPTWWRGLRFRTGGALDLAVLAHWLPGQAASSPGLDPEVAGRLRAAAFEPATLIDADGRVDLEQALAHPTLSTVPEPPADLDGVPPFAARWASAVADARPEPGPPPVVDVDAAVLVVAGWWDPFLAESVATFAALSSAPRPDRHRLVITGFGHGFDPPREHPPTEVAWRFPPDVDVAWAEEHLLGIDHGLQRLDPVTWYVVGADRWRGADQWPPADARIQTMVLHPDGSMGPGSTATGVLSWPHDPERPVPSRGAAGMLLPPGPADVTDLGSDVRPDVVSFVGEELAGPLELAGPVTATLTTSSTATVVDVVARLAHVAPDGSATVVASGIRRTASGPEPATVTVDVGHVGHLVPAGHRLRLDICGSDFPRHDPTPAEPATHRIHTGGTPPSSLTITTLPGEPT